MAKNYAKFVPPKSRAFKKKKWRPEIVIAVVLVLTGVTAFGSFLYVERTGGAVANSQNVTAFFSKWVALLHHKKTPAVDKLTNKKMAAAEAGQPPAVQFDFYNALPNMQMPSVDNQSSATHVPLPSVALAPSASPPVVAAKTPAEPPAQSDEMMAEAKPTVIPPATTTPAVPVNVPKPIASDEVSPVFQPEDVSDLLAAEHAVQGYVIQLGVFQSESAAIRLREAIVSVGFNPVIVKVSHGGRKLYHVQQGPYESAALAKASQQRLEKRGIISIIQKASA